MLILVVLFSALVPDAFGNRVSKTVNGVTTQYLVEDDVNPTGLPQVVEELSGPIGAGVVTRTYTYGLQRINQNLSPVVTGNSTWTPSFYVYDGAGSVRQLTDINLKVTDEYEYDAYGNSFTKTGTTPNNYLYRGEQYDTDLGLYYLRARYYNPGTGRFISRDPLNGLPNDPASLHKYVYASADPVDLSDSLGREADPLPTPGPVPMPPPGPLAPVIPFPSKPSPQPPNSGAGVEYSLVVGMISLSATAALPPVAEKVECTLKTAASALLALSQNLGFLQNLQLNWSDCSATSSKMPDMPPHGPYPAPFFPSPNWATNPGNPWDCQANSEGWITNCSNRCPNGGEEWITWDPGTKYGEPPHWDFHRCDNTTCKIYLDGSSTCSSE
jgi:RHS repeat-associated protein